MISIKLRAGGYYLHFYLKNTLLLMIPNERALEEDMRYRKAFLIHYGKLIIELTH